MLLSTNHVSFSRVKRYPHDNPLTNKYPSDSTTASHVKSDKMFRVSIVYRPLGPCLENTPYTRCDRWLSAPFSTPTYSAIRAYVLDGGGKSV